LIGFIAHIMAVIFVGAVCLTVGAFALALVIGFVGWALEQSSKGAK